MLLTELHGYKQYLGKSARKILADLSQKHGAYAENGVHAVVIMTRHDFVYKLWKEDKPWESWLDYIKSNPDKHFPKILGSVKEFPFEFKHQENPDSSKVYKLKYVKIEKLKALPDDLYDLIDYANGLSLGRFNKFEDFAKRLSDSNEDEDGANLVKTHLEFLKVYFKVAKHYEKLYGIHDMHADNVMARSDGTLVITDPASEATSLTSIEAPELVQLLDTELKRVS